MDDFDRASIIEELMRDTAIRNAVRSRPNDDAVSATHCMDDGCGLEIPEERRLAVRGCQYCVQCQSKRESAAKRRF